MSAVFFCAKKRVITPKRGLPYILVPTSKSLPTSDFYKTKNQKSEDFKKWQETTKRSTSSKSEAKKYNEAKTYRKEREGMLRPNQWEDLIVRVYI